MSLAGITPLSSDTVDPKHFLRLAASLEIQSEHSVAKAIVGAADKGSLFRVEKFTVHPGLGVEGVIDGTCYTVGSGRFVGIEEDDTESATTAVYLAREKKVVAKFEIADRLREETLSMVTKLKKRLITLWIVSGDREATVAAIAKQAGIANYRAATMPVGKAQCIETMQKEGACVAMVGDGINDAPALAMANVGIGVASGTDIAMESADIVLMREDLCLIPAALLLAKKTFLTIRLNLFWALGYNFIALPLAFFGVLHPIICAGAMAISSLCVVGNSLFLRRIEGRI